jgi:hypothetical protein
MPRRSLSKTAAASWSKWRLNGHEVGDGLLARVCAEVQARYRAPPALDGRGRMPIAGKHGR